MPMNSGAADPEPEDDRVELQGTLGQIHGLLHTAVEAHSQWCPTDAMVDIKAAYEALGPAFGGVQAELNSGRLDETRPLMGLAGRQFVPKREGLRRALRRLAGGFALKPFRTALRWAETIAGSLGREVPGAEIIGEFVQVVQNATEEYEERRAPAQTRSGKQSDGPQ